MRKWAINGRFIVRKQTGQERFAQELLKELDKIIDKGEFVLVVPKYASDIPNYKNIEIQKYGSIRSHLWEQISFYSYIRKKKLLSINLTQTCPILSPGIVCIHDAAFFEIKDLLAKTLYGKLSVLWHKLIFKAAAKWSKKILVVSEYSKNRILFYLKVPNEKVAVVYNSWQHFERVTADDNIFSKLPTTIVKDEFFLALSSFSPQKNFIWIKEVAIRNPNKKFVIVGSAEGFTTMNSNEFKLPNIHFTGYISDSEIKSLMSHCKAFIHPAIYEGFGIPPLEALSCGAKIVVSTATCLPEIYKKSVHYIDPYCYDVDLDVLLKQPIESGKKVLERFSWAQSALNLLDIIRAAT